MRISRLRLFHYRNIGELDITLGPGVTLFSGRNGQGKTNILESIYFLAYGRSFRTSTPKDCIRHGETECRIEGVVERGRLERTLGVTLRGAEKTLSLYGKPSPLEDFVGNLHLLAFTHAHLGVVRGGPADRRAFLDRAMVSLYPGHVRALASYGRALRQRNRVLAELGAGARPADAGLLESWDEALVGEGVRILANRLRYVRRMKSELPEGLFGSESLRMHYLSTIGAEDPDPAALGDLFRKGLGRARERDLRTGTTSVGPHRDDLKLYVNGKSLGEFGSAGQQRSGLLALYFSQMEIHAKEQGFYPVFLVDDAEAELDQERLHTFLHYLARRTQTILTSAKDFLVPSLELDPVRFEVLGGRVRTPGPGSAPVTR
ncbi:MAG: DNA replication/repair protein RecF [Acidobacteria bacterium]|nr:DNA replication/repair protein RecF [Acidobacteriota bacterium]